VFILPPIIYESSLLMIKKNEVLSKIGSILMSQTITVLLVAALFMGLVITTGINALPGIGNSTGANMIFIMSLII
jgi:hypothetical protein